MLLPNFITSVMAVVSYNDDDYKERLIKAVKKEVKQIMEEAVTRKFVHQESSSVTSLCGAVESCLSHGLRRRALGLFRSSSTTALLHKVAKSYNPAEIVSKMVTEAEAAEGIKRSSSSGDSMTKLGNKPPLQKKGSGGFTLGRSISMTTASTPRYLWIRIALFEKLLAGIIEHLVQNSNKYYEKDALVADPEYGSLLGHLLVGPCALDYSRMKTQDHYWTDPPADELVQRHRISSGAAAGPNSPANRRPGLNVRKLVHGTSSGDETPRIPSKDYVESLHQNNKLTLLYGKNNVLVYARDQTEPIAGYLSLHQAPSYLILKWTPNQLMNGVIDTDVDKSYNEQNDLHHVSFKNYDQPHSVSVDVVDTGREPADASRQSHYEKNDCPQNVQTRRNSTGNWPNRRIQSFIWGYHGNQPNIYWDYALNVCISDIVYVHCHQQASDQGGTLVLVGQDGVQRSPIHFPAGGHLLAFLSCLETGLLPHGQLDPPLWTQTGKGKVFPRIKRKGISPEAGDTEESMDYVFRIVFKSHSALDHSSTGDMMDSPAAASPFLTKHTPSAPPNSTLTTPSPVNCGRNKRAFRFSDSTNSSTSSSKSLSGSCSMADNTNSIETIDEVRKPPKGYTQTVYGIPIITGRYRDSLQVLCNTMKRQIISRAFYGWLAHCRHLRTVRKHLSGLVNPVMLQSELLKEDELGITLDTWESLFENQRLSNANEVYRLVYYGGVDPSLRKQVWPYLLGHYQFGSSQEEREEQDSTIRRSYETTVSEWLAVEAITRQRDREATAKATFQCKKNSGSGSAGSVEGDQVLPPTQRSLSNEVFEDFADQEDNEEESDDDEELHFEDVVDDGTLTETETETFATAETGPSTEQVIVVTSHDLSTRGESISDANELDLVTEAVSGLHVQQKLNVEEDLNSLSSRRSSCVSPASSQGGVYSNELLDSFALNLHRIDKDVQRCDRNYCYFTNPAHLDKLRNVMCTYVWEHLDPGYMQGMCDLAAPLLVIFDDEALTYSCFTELMKRMGANFPHGGVMDTHFANMRSLIQILDAEMFDLMHQNGDYTHFYFCYRWFLLDFKRELPYEDVFSVWETIWAARHVASAHFVLFLALALVQYYRDIILDNSMDFTDIIKFFNEMAERHDAKALLKMARNLVLQLQTLIDNK